MLTVDETEENTGKLLSALGAKPHVAFRTRSVEAVRSLVATGAGIALLPISSTARGRWKATGSRAATFRAPCRWCRWAWSGGAGRRLPQAARDFIGIAQAQVAARQRQ